MGASASDSSHAASATPTTGSNSIRIPARVPPMSRMPVRKPNDGIAAAAIPVKARRGRTFGFASGWDSDCTPPATRATATAPIPDASRTVVIACSVGTSRVPVASEDHEDRLADGRAERQRDADDVEPDPAAGSSCDATTRTMPTIASARASTRLPSSRSRPRATLETATSAGYV